MIRPCDQCGGKGEVPMVEDTQGDFLVSCPRCEGMPKLLCVTAGLTHTCDDDHVCGDGGWFYPDPDSEGLARIETDDFDDRLLWAGTGPGIHDCWVLVTPLEEAT